MLRRLAPLPLVLAAVAADVGGDRGLAFYALLLAIPAVVAAGLDRFGAALEGTGERRHAIVLTLVLVLVVLSAAVRSPHLAEHALPALAASTLAAAAALLVLQAVAGLFVAAPQFRRGSLHSG